MKIYLCSRIAKDAHEINNSVSSVLRQEGHKVFVPHEQHYNQIMSDTAHLVSDEEIFTQDYTAMQDSDACVVVGRIGVDCGYEIGWFQSRGLPVVWFRPEASQRHPMLTTVSVVTSLESLSMELAVSERESFFHTTLPLGFLGREAFDTAVQKGFYTLNRSPLEFHALFHTEISEATKEIRNGTDGEATELADCLIRILDYCHYRGFQIDSVVRNKMQKNRSRPYLHGGKTK